MEATLDIARPISGIVASDYGATRLRSIDIISEEADFLALEPVWNLLLAQSATQTPFLAWTWVREWWTQMRGEFELAIGVVRDEHGTVEAIAPLMIGRPREWQRRHLRHLLFLTDGGDIMPEGMDFIVPAGCEARLTPALSQIFRELRGCYDAVLLNTLHADSPNIPHIIAAIRETCAATAEINSEPSWMTALPESWEAVEMSHGPNWRSNHRRKWKKMITQHQGRPLLAGRDLSADEAFDALIALHGRRWTVEESSFLRTGTMRFHRTLAKKLIAEGRAMICLLELDGQPAAATYCLVHEGKANFYQAGWNADYSGISIGKMAVAWTIQCAIERGLKLFDFLPGDHGYKREWGDSSRRVFGIEAYAPFSPRAIAFRTVRFIKQKFFTKDNSTGQPAPHEATTAPAEATREA